MLVFAEAVATGDPRTRNLYFDIATNVISRTSAEKAAFITARIRQIGVQRILYSRRSHGIHWKRPEVGHLLAAPDQAP